MEILRIGSKDYECDLCERMQGYNHEICENCAVMKAIVPLHRMVSEEYADEII